MTAAFARLADALADRYRIERELGAGGSALQQRPEEHVVPVVGARVVAEAYHDEARRGQDVQALSTGPCRQPEIVRQVRREDEAILRVRRAPRPTGAARVGAGVLSHTPRPYPGIGGAPTTALVQSGPRDELLIVPASPLEQ